MHFGHGGYDHGSGALTQRDLDRRVAVQRSTFATHPLQRFLHLHVAEHVDVTRLLQRNAERLLKTVVQQCIAGQVMEVAQYHPVTFAEGNGRRRA
ncbi:hypothetical protein D3C71_1258720 [compost metagenome]